MEQMKCRSKYSVLKLEHQTSGAKTCCAIKVFCLQGTPLNDGIAKFYDESTPLWESMWGEHLHHGYYGKADKPKSNLEAQIDMIEEVLKWAGVKKVSKVSSTVPSLINCPNWYHAQPP